MIEFEIDMAYCDEELNKVVLIDENGEMHDRVFVPERTCHAVGMDYLGNTPYNESEISLDCLCFGCSECGYPWSGMNTGSFQVSRSVNYCPNCGAKVAE